MSVRVHIPDGPWGFIHLVGGGGGKDLYTTGWVQNSKAATVKTLSVWYSGSCLHGIQVMYTDATSSTVNGTTNGSYGRFDFQPGELLTTMTLWGNGVGTRTGRIRFTTNKGNTFDVGKDTSGQSAYDCPVSSGFLMGFVGRCGNDIDCLGALFLRSPVVSVSISEVSYKQNIIGSSTGIAPVVLDEVDFINPPTSSKPIAFTFGGSETRISSMTYSQTTSDTFTTSASVEVSGEILGVGATATAGFEWQRGNSQTTESSVSEEVEFHWDISGDLQPGESVQCLAVVYRGKCRLDYSSKVVVKLKDGFTNTFQENGTFDNIALSKVVVQADYHSAQRLREAFKTVNELVGIFTADGRAIDRGYFAGKEFAPGKEHVDDQEHGDNGHTNGKTDHGGKGHHDGKEHHGGQVHLAGNGQVEGDA